MNDYPQYVGETDDSQAWDTTFRMVGSPEAMGELFSALAQARAEFPPIPKDAMGKVFAKNGAERSFKFSSYNAIMTAVAGPLGKHGLALTQPSCSWPGGKTRILTILAKGEARLETAIEFENPQTGSASPEADLKAFGGRSTYIRRYAIKGLLAVEGDDDADAEPIDERPQSPRPEPMGRPVGRPPGRPPRQPQQVAPQAAPQVAPEQPKAPLVSPPPPPQAPAQAPTPTIPEDPSYHDTEPPPPPEPQVAPNLMPGSEAQQESLLTLAKYGLGWLDTSVSPPREIVGMSKIRQVCDWVGAALNRPVNKNQLRGLEAGFVTEPQFRYLLSEARAQCRANGRDPDKILSEKKGT